MLSKSIKTRNFLTRALTIATIICAAPLHAETQDLAIGKYKASIAFPCTPKRQKQLSAKTEVGDVFFTSLLCSRGEAAYLLGVTEYPPQIVSASSVEEMLDSTADDARSKSFMKIISSKRTMHGNLPAIHHHFLDTRKPETASFSIAVLAGQNMVVAHVTAPPNSAQSKATTDFLNSLQITPTKK